MREKGKYRYLLLLVLTVLLLIPATVSAETNQTFTTDITKLPANHVYINQKLNIGSSNATVKIIKTSTIKQTTKWQSGNKGTFKQMIYYQNDGLNWGTSEPTKTSSAQMSKNVVSGNLFSITWSKAATLSDGSKADVKMTFHDLRFYLGPLAPAGEEKLTYGVHESGQPVSEQTAITASDTYNIAIAGESGESSLSFVCACPKLVKGTKNTGFEDKDVARTTIKQSIDVDTVFLKPGTSTPIDSKFNSALISFYDLDAMDQSKAYGEDPNDKGLYPGENLSASVKENRYEGLFSESIGLLEGWLSNEEAGTGKYPLYRTSNSYIKKVTSGTDSDISYRVRGSEETNENKLDPRSSFIGAVRPQGFTYRWYGSYHGKLVNASITNMGTFIGETPKTILIRKTLSASSDEGGSVSGMRFTVKKNGSSDSWDLVTDTSGQTYITGLSAGTYTVSENLTEAQKANYINKTGTKTLEVNDDSTITELGIDWVNEYVTRRSVRIEKNDHLGKPLAGAQLQIRNAAGTPVHEWTSNGSPHEVKLAFGTYQLVETKAPSGYEAFSPVSFRLSIDGAAKTGTWPSNLALKSDKETITAADQPLYKVTYEWVGEHPDKPVPPGQTGIRYKGTHTTDVTYKPGDEVPGEKDGRGGMWSFKGWDHSGTLTITEDKVIRGTWKFTPCYFIETEVVGGTITPVIHDIPEGENRNIHYDPYDGYQMVSVTVDGEEVDPAEYPNDFMFADIRADHRIRVVYELIPDLEITKISDREYYNAGDIASYTVMVRQTVEGAEARKVSVTDLLPEGLTLIRDSIEADAEMEITNAEDNTYTVVLTCPLTETPVMIRYQAQTNQEIRSADLKNVVKTGAENVPNEKEADNTIRSRTPDPEIIKEAGVEKAGYGDEITYTIIAKNNEPGAQIRNAVISDDVPEGIEVDYDSFEVTVPTAMESNDPAAAPGAEAEGMTDANGTTEADDPAAAPDSAADGTTDGGAVLHRPEGDSRAFSVAVPVILDQIKISFRARVTAGQGAVKNTAVLTGDDIPECSDDAVIEVIPPVLSISKEADRQEVKTGDVVNYTIVGTAADAPALDAVITDQIPEGIDVYENSIECSDPDAEIGYEANVITARIPVLESSVTITYTAEITKTAEEDGTELKNVAVLDAANNPGDPVSDDAIISVRPSPPQPRLAAGNPPAEEPPADDPPARIAGESPAMPSSKTGDSMSLTALTILALLCMMSAGAISALLIRGRSGRAR